MKNNYVSTSSACFDANNKNRFETAIKKITLGLVFLVGTASNCHAQSKHRFAFGVGLFGHEYISELIAEHEETEQWRPSPDDYTPHESTEEKLISVPININFHYELILTTHFSAGISLGIDHLRMRQETEVSTCIGQETSPHGQTYMIWNQNHQFGRLHRVTMRVMPEAYIYWFKKKYVSMYSKLAAGLALNYERKEIYSTGFDETKFKDTHFTFQASPVCVEVGGKWWRAFGEFGYGSQGIAQYGVKHTFKGKDYVDEDESLKDEVD